MKSFRQFIDEATLNKQIKNTKTKDTGIVSRDRGGHTEKENRSERKSLEKKLRRAKTGYSKNVGKYKEDGQDKATTEVSYQLTRNPKRHSKKGFERFTKNIGKKDAKGGKQDTVITQRAGKDAVMHQTNALKGKKPEAFKIGKAKYGSHPDPEIGKTSPSKVRSQKKPKSTGKGFHYR